MRLDGDTVREDPTYHRTLRRQGLWKAEVVNNLDMERRGRLQVRILHLHPLVTPVGSVTTAGSAAGDLRPRTYPTGIPAALTPWAEPAFPFGGRTGSPGGFIMLPEVGSTVWVAFEMGVTGRPVWLGSWLGLQELPPEMTNVNYLRMIRTPMGGILSFNDTPANYNVFLGALTAPNTSVRYLHINETLKTVSIVCGTPGVGSQVVLTESDIEIQLGGPAAGQRILIRSAPPAIYIAVGPVGSGNFLQIDGSGVQLIGGSNILSLTNAGALTLTAALTAAINAAGIVSLGVGAAKGVALDSLLTVFNLVVGVFNAHTHNYTDDGVPMVTAGPNTAAIPGVPGVDTSLTVLART
jgi:hypothetical protein